MQVEAEKKKTEEEKKVAVAVKDFLQNKLLGRGRCEDAGRCVAQGRCAAAEAKTNPTIGELLDRAAVELSEAKIEANFPGQPLLQAELLLTAGNTYRGIGAYERAIGFLQRSLALRKQHLGPDHTDMLTSMNSLPWSIGMPGSRAWPCRFSRKTIKLRKAETRARSSRHGQYHGTFRSVAH